MTAEKSEGSWIRLEKKSVSLFTMLDLAKENALLKYKHNPEININCPENLELICDEFHAYNMFFNVIDNAVKYSQPNSEVTISVSKETPWIVTIEDNGIGISTKHFKHIFDKFYRVPRVDSKEIKGFGIGLFYVKKIVTLHQWQIKLKNVTPQGLSVNIIIPEKDIQ